jgi:hypothetical protein
MNIYVALSLFSVLIVVYLIITEMFSIMFRFTGLPSERARFQVVSLLTGCGYTTKESEMFLSSRSRRRLARITMLFGYVFNITIVSAFINVFLSIKLTDLGENWLSILIPLSVAAVVFIFIRVTPIRAWLEGLLRKIADRILKRGETFNSVMLMDYIGSDSIAVVTLNHIPEQYLGRSLADMKLKAETGILVMLVEHPGKKPEAAGADTVFAVGDKLTVFGSYKTICRTFDAHESFEDQ